MASKPTAPVAAVTPKATAAEAGAATRLQKYAAPSVGIGVPLGLAAIEALPGKYIKAKQEETRLQGEALRKGGAQLTSTDISGAQLAGEAHERKARAMVSRGSASGGRSGLDVERARDVRRQGAQKTAMRLSEAGRRRLGEYAAKLGAWQKQSEFLGKEAIDRKNRLFGRLHDVAGSKTTEKLLGVAGESERDLLAKKIGMNLLGEEK